MANFSLYLPLLRANEGGYCQTPGDSGGETYRGVSRVWHPTWPGWALVDAIKTQQNLPAPVPAADWLALSSVLEANVALGNEVVAFYEANFWNPLQLSAITSQALANQLMDHGVNTSPWRPARMVQHLLITKFGAQLVFDGELGPATVAAINQANGPQLYQYFVEMRRAYYYYLADYTPTPALPDAASWADFMIADLAIRPQPDMQQFLHAWLSRTEEPYA